MLTVIVVSGLRVLSVHLDWTDPVFPGDHLRSGDPLAARRRDRRGVPCQARQWPILAHSVSAREHGQGLASYSFPAVLAVAAARAQRSSPAGAQISRRGDCLRTNLDTRRRRQAWLLRRQLDRALWSCPTTERIARERCVFRGRARRRPNLKAARPEGKRGHALCRPAIFRELRVRSAELTSRLAPLVTFLSFGLTIAGQERGRRRQLETCAVGEQGPLRRAVTWYPLVPRASLAHATVVVTLGIGVHGGRAGADAELLVDVLEMLSDRRG